ncbi:hypothetical protein [Shewanella atlantica]|uniref:DUF1176 domain-containing protein n=1 Tax=Shewanella atlantica TaxID=271099 RepID=A0A431VVG9_9GAMM|nr:hypothetical protein [Shewanella atlantica]RTR27203.1 hypothetical protein EKG39_20645 [Shewanella atlantica]
MNKASLWLLAMTCSLSASLYVADSQANTEGEATGPTPLVFNKNRAWNPKIVIWQDSYWQCAKYSDDGTCDSVEAARDPKESTFGDIDLLVINDGYVCEVFFENDFRQTLSLADFDRYAGIMTERKLWNETDIQAVRLGEPLVGMSMCGVQSLMGTDASDGYASENEDGTMDSWAEYQTNGTQIAFYFTDRILSSFDIKDWYIDKDGRVVDKADFDKQQQVAKPESRSSSQQEAPTVQDPIITGQNTVSPETPSDDDEDWLAEFDDILGSDNEPMSAEEKATLDAYLTTIMAKDKLRREQQLKFGDVSVREYNSNCMSAHRNHFRSLNFYPKGARFSMGETEFKQASQFMQSQKLWNSIDADAILQGKSSRGMTACGVRVLMGDLCDGTGFDRRGSDFGTIQCDIAEGKTLEYHFTRGILQEVWRK